MFFKIGTARKFRLITMSYKNVVLASNSLSCLGQQKRKKFHGWPQVPRFARELPQVTSLRAVKKILNTCAHQILPFFNSLIQENYTLS